MLITTTYIAQHFLQTVVKRSNKQETKAFLKRWTQKKHCFPAVEKNSQVFTFGGFNISIGYDVIEQHVSVVPIKKSDTFSSLASMFTVLKPK